MSVARYPTKRLQRLASMVCGDFPATDRTLMEEAFDIVEYRGLNAHEALLKAQLERTSPLAQAANLTRLVSESPPLESRRLMVLDRANFAELLYFWTIRGCLLPFGDDVRVVGLPVEAFGAGVDLSPLLPWVAASPVPEKPELVVSTGRGAREAVRRRLLDLGLVEYTGHTMTRYFGDPPDGRHATEFALWDSQAVPVTERGLEQIDLATLAPGSNYLRLRPPQAFASRRFRYGGWLAVEIKDLPLPLPLNRTAAGRILANADGYQQRLVVTTDARASDLHFPSFTMPSAEEALSDFMAEFGRTARMSAPGNLAATLLGRLDSVAELDVLVSDTAERIVLFLARGDASGRLTPRTLDQVVGEIRCKRRVAAVPLAGLVRYGFVQRGIQVQCPTCRFEDFFLFAELDEHVSCRGCRTRIPVPTVDEGGRETRVSYRLDSLTARAVAADILPVMQAIRRLIPEGHLADGHALWPGVEILRSGQAGVEVEIDVLIGRGSTVTVCEAKTRAEGLTPAQASRTITVAAEIGAQAVFYARVGDYSTRVRKLADRHGAQLLR